MEINQLPVDAPIPDGHWLTVRQNEANVMFSTNRARLVLGRATGEPVDGVDIAFSSGNQMSRRHLQIDRLDPTKMRIDYHHGASEAGKENTFYLDRNNPACDFAVPFSGRTFEIPASVEIQIIGGGSYDRYTINAIRP